MSESEIAARPTIRVPEWMDSQIEAKLGYDDSKAEWIREACRQRVQRERDTEADQ